MGAGRLWCGCRGCGARHTRSMGGGNGMMGCVCFSVIGRQRWLFAERGAKLIQAALTFLIDPEEP